MAHKRGSETAELGRRFGRNLVEFRRRAGLSQVATAERAGLHRTEVGLVEAGERLPRLDTIVRLAGAVEVQPCALLTGMAWKLEETKEESR